MPATSVFGRFRRQTQTGTQDSSARSSTLSPPPPSAPGAGLAATTSLPSHVPEEHEGQDGLDHADNLTPIDTANEYDQDISPTNTSAPAQYGIFPEPDRDRSRQNSHSQPQGHQRNNSILSLSSSVKGLRKSVSLRSQSSPSPFGHRSRQSSTLPRQPTPPDESSPSRIHPSQTRKKSSISTFPFYKQAKSAENLTIYSPTYDDAPPVPSLSRFDLSSKNAFPMLASGTTSLRRQASDRPSVSSQGVGGSYGAPLQPAPTLQSVSMAGQNPSAVYQSILETTQKRMATIDYLKRVHEGDVYYLTTLHYPPGSVSALPSMHPHKLGRRSTSYFLLGYSLPALLELNSGSPMEYLKALIALLNEFETYQNLSGTDSASNSLGRGRMGQMFKSGIGLGKGPGKGRRSSSAVTDPLSLDPQSNTFTGFPTSGLGSPQEVTSPIKAAGHDFQHLLTPSLPFDPDFGTTFATLCDTMVETYQNLLNLITTPEQCSPMVGEAFAKADKSVRKILVANVMREFEDSTRNGIKNEVAGLGKLVLGGLMKFGKHIQKRQLDIPEYAASFVDYKALKKLIKHLSKTPILAAQQPISNGITLQDSQASLQSNKAAFFFRLERELEKVNELYLQKEAELKLRLRTLLDKKRSLHSRATPASKLSSSYVTLDEGFRLFSNDLDKLQQFVEVNQTAFSKILKKWDKTSKSREKEIYLSRAVEVQPCFNRDVISDLSDQATTGLLELQAWAEGEKIAYTPAVELENRAPEAGQDELELEVQILQAVNAGDTGLVKEWAARTVSHEEARERISRVFLNTVNTAAPATQQVLYDTGLINFNYADSINERNCIHEAAVSGKKDVLNAALSSGANIRAPDVYGRIPLHYASMHGQAEMMRILVTAAPDTVDAKDLDNFTGLVHGIVHSRTASVQEMLRFGAAVNPSGSNDHIPLNLACQYGSVAIVEQILQYKPQMLPDAEGLYPQHIVARFGRNQQLLCLLRDYGMDMDQADKLYQWTPIFHAASEGHLHCLQQLLEFEVDAIVNDEKDLSAMYYAAWEGHLDCMQLLAQAGLSATQRKQDSIEFSADTISRSHRNDATPSMAFMDSENIPDLILPPPIIPLRRYGHNFLDTTKTFILLSFDDLGCDAIEFYGDSKYPAARLTISSKSSDLIPRNVPLPVQDDFKNISFQIENLDTFSIDFDIFPTFGSKVIARSAASSRVFTGKPSSSGRWHLELFDPRLRAIGRINFRYQVITPFRGSPLEITHFATYWKATSQFDNHPSNLITGSSLSGDFLRLFVQVTKDGVPILFPEWAMPTSKNDLIGRLTYEEFSAAAANGGTTTAAFEGLLDAGIDPEDLPAAQHQIVHSHASLKDALAMLPADLNLELHVCYPTRNMEEKLQLGPSQNINFVVDAILMAVFDHARHLRESKDNPLRNFVFSSYNADVCAALNWKQPNYPVLLCNELGVAPKTATTAANQPDPQNAMIASCGRTDMSIKEAVRIAQSNNLMGLICTSRLLQLVPALVDSIKEAGLVLISDYSHDVAHPSGSTGPAPSVLGLQKGVDGLVAGNAVLRFREAVD